MPSVEENRIQWGTAYGWPDGGEEWSQVWGGSRAQWLGTIEPRLEPWLPAQRILEIGCGFGRWSGFLRQKCQELHLVDLVAPCVEACRRRFAGDSAVRVDLTDGRSIPTVGARSIDLAFSFDSLVHAELAVLEAYFRELSRVLRTEGVAFVHHSNFAAVLAARPGTHNVHWRDESCSAEAVAASARASGLVAWIQEIVDWGGVAESDCLTTLVLAGSPRARTPVRRADNPHFMGEAQSIGVRSRLYRDELFGTDGERGRAERPDGAASGV